MIRLLISSCLLATLLASCSSTSNGSESDNDAGGSGQLVVFAATSLSDAFTQLAGSFEAETGVEVTLQFAGSQVLSRQLIEGARADVFAAADTVTMDRVIDAGVTTQPSEIFTDNVLALVTPGDNPGGVTGLDDLADNDLVVALCAVDVPCGRASAAVLADLGIDASADTFEASVRSTLAKVVLGEVDAALVYRSDVIGATDDTRANDEIVAIELSATEAAVIDANRQSYPIAITTDLDRGPQQEALARDFIDFVQSGRGQLVLEGLGFSENSE